MISEELSCAGMVDTLDEAVDDITEAFRTAGFMLRR